MEKREHLLITGTGRAGTTFLVELFTNLGFDTGFDPKNVKEKKFKIARAGLEHDLRSENCPYVVKDPVFCDYAEEVFSNPNITIKHIFVPIRDIHAAAESRRFVTKTTQETSLRVKTKALLGMKQAIAGGLWEMGSDEDFEKQENVLLNKLYSLMLAVSDTYVNITLIKYPRSTKDAAYLFQKLAPVLKDISFEKFTEIYHKTVQPELVHSFNKKDK